MSIGVLVGFVFGCGIFSVLCFYLLWFAYIVFSVVYILLCFLSVVFSLFSVSFVYDICEFCLCE